jgi:hypothetical protein
MDVFAMTACSAKEGGKEAEVDVLKILDKAAKSAFRGGAAGAAAMGINVFSLMWMRTTMNYQYRYGTSMTTALRTLYADGGILRFYRGVGFALIQGPWSRFGDTAANTGTLELMNAFEATKDLNASVKTVGASAAAAVFRMGSTPIDTCKTIMQVEGRAGLTQLHGKYMAAGGFPRGVPVLWHGAYGTVGATFVGHYPWFATYNALQDQMPKTGYVQALGLPIAEKHHNLLDKLIKNACIGFAASAVSDTASNSIRVVKVYKQTHKDNMTYLFALQSVIKEGGMTGLFFRGLGTKVRGAGAARARGPAWTRERGARDWKE